MRACPETGHEELIVIMGPDGENSRPFGGMVPFALDLETFTWRRGAFRDAAAHIAIPAARQRPGTMKIAGRWLLVGEGTPLPVSPPVPIPELESGGSCLGDADVAVSFSIPARNGKRPTSALNHSRRLHSAQHVTCTCRSAWAGA